jgi:hypothetical protein
VAPTGRSTVRRAYVSGFSRNKQVASITRSSLFGKGVTAIARSARLSVKAITGGRPTADHVSKVIAEIGRQAGIVVKSPRAGEKTATKYASAHDLRRGVAFQMVNAGVSAETH